TSAIPRPGPPPCSSSSSSSAGCPRPRSKPSPHRRRARTSVRARSLRRAALVLSTSTRTCRIRPERRRKYEAMKPEDHPIIDIIWSALVRGRRGPRSLAMSADGAKAIEASVRLSLVRGDIAECCEAALSVLGFLSGHDSAREAVCELRRLRRQLAPEIDAAFARRRARLKRDAEAALLVAKQGVERVEKFGAPAPAGSVKNRNLMPTPS